MTRTNNLDEGHLLYHNLMRQAKDSKPCKACGKRVRNTKKKTSPSLTLSNSEDATTTPPLQSSEWLDLLLEDALTEAYWQGELKNKNGILRATHDKAKAAILKKFEEALVEAKPANPYSVAHGKTAVALEAAEHAFNVAIETYAQNLNSLLTPQQTTKEESE